MREVRPGPEENARTVDARLRAAVAVLGHLMSQLVEKDVYSVWFQQSQGSRVADLGSVGRFFLRIRTFPK